MSKGFVCNAYINHLLRNDKDKLNNHLEPLHFDAWFVYNCDVREPVAKNINSKFSDFMENQRFEYLGVLHKAQTETISDIDGLEAETSYEGLFNTPVSSYLFSNFDKPTTGTLIERDIYYSAFNYNVYDAKKANYNIAQMEGVISDADRAVYDSEMKHFTENYNFSSGYNANEYRIYSIPEEPVCEGQTNLKTDDIVLSSTKPGFIGNGIMITWYDGNRAEKHNSMNMIEYQPINSGDAIPCAFYALPKTYAPHNDKIKVEWSDDGMFSVT